MHTYADPVINFDDPDRPLVLGEYGGLGLNVEGHRWYEKFAQTYNDNGSIEGVTSKYEYYANIVNNLAKGVTYNDHKSCFAAAVYTQITDVETEVNGLMTYDREVVKVYEDRIKAANSKIINANSSESITGISHLRDVHATGRDTFYNAMGMQTNGLTRGLNIIRRADGSSVKYLKN